MVDFVLEQLDNGKAIDLVKIDLHGRSSFADYLIIATGTSSRHVTALADNVSKELKKQGYTSKIEGKNGDGNWVVLDCYDIIVHLFSEEARLYYGLEDMWQKA